LPLLIVFSFIFFRKIKVEFKIKLYFVAHQRYSTIHAAHDSKQLPHLVSTEKE